MKWLFLLLFVLLSFSFAQKSEEKISTNIDTVQSVKTNQSVNPETKNDNDVNYWKLFLDFISNPFTSAALASIITLIATNIYNARQKRKEELANYKSLLSSTNNELEFYISKLEQLKIDSNNIINAIKTQNSPPIIPTYSIYPRFLENSKIELSKFYKNSDIIKRVGHCHFELSHICERLELIKKELRTNYDPQKEVANIGGFLKLVESNLIEFNDVVRTISKELTIIKD